MIRNEMPVAAGGVKYVAVASAFAVGQHPGDDLGEGEDRLRLGAVVGIVFGSALLTGQSGEGGVAQVGFEDVPIEVGDIGRHRVDQGGNGARRYSILGVAPFAAAPDIIIRRLSTPDQAGDDIRGRSPGARHHIDPGSSLGSGGELSGFPADRTRTALR